jgi:hypothetical protein
MVTTGATVSLIQTICAVAEVCPEKLCAIENAKDPSAVFPTV